MSVIKQIRALDTEEKFQNSLINNANDTGDINAYKVDLYPVLEEYQDYLTIIFKASNTNTGSSTLQANSLNPVTIVKYGTGSLESGDIKQNQVVTVVYNTPYFHLQNPSSAFIEDASNIIQNETHRFVTDSQINTFTNKQDALNYTPENLSNKGIAGGYAPLNSESQIPLLYIPPIGGAGGTTVHVVSGSVQRLLLSGSIPLISGDGCYQYGNGESYIWDSLQWRLTATPEWGNINIDWSNVIGKPTTFTPASHSHSSTDIGLGNVTNVQQLPISYLDIDPLLASNSDIKVPSQKAIKSYIDSVSSVDLSSFNNKILNLEACAQLDAKIPPGSGNYGRVYDIMNNTNYYSVGTLDNTNTVLSADLTAGNVSASVLSNTGFSTGQEITIQDITNIERKIISGVVGNNIIVFTVPISNSYSSTVTKVYRSLISLNTTLKQMSFPQLFGTLTDTFVKLDDPNTLQITNVQGISFTSDATYLATGNVQGTSGQNDLYIYKKNDGVDTYSILYIPSNAVPIRDLKFDQTDTYLAVAHSAASPFLKIYKRVGDIFTLLSNPSYLPPSNCYSLWWGSNGTYLAVGCDSSPYIIIYKRTGDVFTVLSNPNVLPSSKVDSVSFSADGVYLVVGFRSNPYCIVYKRSGDTFTKLNITPTFSGDTLPFITPDGAYMLINISPYAGFDVYKRTGDDFALITHLSGTPIKMIFTGDSKYFAVAVQSYPYLYLYRISTGDVFTLLSNPNILPTGVGQSVAFSSDGTYLAAGHGTTPYFSIYKKDIGYQDAGEIDLRYEITPADNIKEVLGYFTKSIVTNFNLEGYISFQTEGDTEVYTQLSSSSVNLSASVQEVKLSGNTAESKPVGILKVKATKATGSINTNITKFLGMVR